MALAPDHVVPVPEPPTMADLASMPTDRWIAAVTHDDAALRVTWDDGLVSRYTARWLRDNCACPNCRHPQALERTYTFIDHPPPFIDRVTLEPSGALEVRFGQGSDQHIARYARDWLRMHEPTLAAARVQQHLRRTWDRSIADRMPTVDYVEFMHTDAGLCAWIHALKVRGIVLLRGMPREPGRVLEVARRIGPIRRTNFGEYYDVVSMPNPNASAYTAMGLELHTDLANWRYPPDVQLLACISSSVRGGESVFADGFRVAEDLRRADPAAFELLSSCPMEFRFHDANCDIRASAPTIELRRDGRIERVRFNNWLRSTLVAPDDLVEPLYDALARFWGMLRDSRYRLNLRLEPGDVISYDNHRVLHGRAPFDPTTGERHLQGCYVNLEDVESTLRLLERRRHQP